MSDEIHEYEREGSDFDGIREHPLVTRLIGDRIHEIPDLDVYIGFPGRGIRGDEGPLGGVVRIYLGFDFREYVEVAAEHVRATAPMPGDLRVAVWVASDAPVKRVGPATPRTSREREYLTGPMTGGCYTPDPCGRPVAPPPSSLFPTTTGMTTATTIGGTEPTNCRWCPSS
jgi:hypothetical protein